METALLFISVYNYYGHKDRDYYGHKDRDWNKNHAEILLNWFTQLHTYESS